MFLSRCSKLLGLAALLCAQDPAPEEGALTEHDVAGAAAVLGLEFDADELELMTPGVSERRLDYASIRGFALDNNVAPVFGFSAFLERLAASGPSPEALAAVPRVQPMVLRPDDLEELCFADIPTLAALIQTRQVSCLELTEMYLARLSRLDAELECVITLLPERARERAVELDLELERGVIRGPLHGIPYGAKDLLAAHGAPTTWGAGPFAQQVFGEDAAVVQRLEQAGAVLIAKLSLGELAWGDVWFGGRTNNPWNPAQGSSGSSAGPAAATAAGGVAFSIGSETYGSIVSPSAVCGCSSLRPTFGTVSRRGAMALAWTMDKLGPICRSMTDAALVMEAIAGPDALDDQCLDRPFRDLGEAALAGLRAGFPADSFTGVEGRAFLESLRALGVELVALPLPELPVDELILILTVEAAAAFDQLTTSDRDAELVRQVRHAWPNAMREARLIPAVEYVKANRIRRLLVAEWQALFAEIDVLVHESQHAVVLAATNLTGHPTAVVPTAVVEGLPGSVSFTGALFDDARLVAIADAWQRATGHHLAHPDVGHPSAASDD